MTKEIIVYNISFLYRTARYHWRDGRGKILFAIATGWFLSMGVRLTYPVLLPYLQMTYGLTLSTSGLLLSVLWIAYALGQLPGGLIGDRIGEGAVMSGSMVIAAITLTLVVTGGTVLILFLATALFGFGLALFGTVRLSAISDIYPKQRGTAIGLIAAVGDIGNTVLPPIAGFLAAIIAWEFGFGFAVPFFILAGVYIWIVVPTRTAKTRGSGASLSFEEARNILSVLRRPSIFLILAVQTIGNAIYQAFTGFYPTYLIDMKSVSPMIANGLFALFFALGVFIKPLSGNTFDEIGARKALLLLMGIGGVGFLLLPFVEGVVPLIGVTALVSFIAGRGTITLSYMTVSLPDRIMNTGLGVLRTTYMIIGAASPALFGLIADQGYFDEAFLLLAVISGISLLFIWILPER